MRKSLLLFTALLALSGTALAADFQAGALQVQQPWSLALPGNSANGSVYFSVHNTGSTPDRLLDASSERAERLEIHEHISQDGLMKMRAVPSVTVPPHGNLVFAPGHYHLMLFGLKQPLQEGDRFPVTLRFEHAGPVRIEVAVQALPPAADENPAEHDMSGMKMN